MSLPQGLPGSFMSGRVVVFKGIHTSCRNGTQNLCIRTLFEAPMSRFEHDSQLNKIKKVISAFQPLKIDSNAGVEHRIQMKPTTWKIII